MDQWWTPKTAMQCSCEQYTSPHRFRCPLYPKKSVRHSEAECLNFSGRQSVYCETKFLDAACELKHSVLVHHHTQLVTALLVLAGTFLYRFLCWSPERSIFSQVSSFCFSQDRVAWGQVTTSGESANCISKPLWFASVIMLPCFLSFNGFVFYNFHFFPLKFKSVAGT